MQGHLGLVKWAHSMNCPVTDDITGFVAAAGEREMLQWMHENEFPFSSETVNFATEGGNLAVLDYILHHAPYCVNQPCAAPGIEHEAFTMVCGKNLVYKQGVFNFLCVCVCVVGFGQWKQRAPSNAP